VLSIKTSVSTLVQIFPAHLADENKTRREFFFVQPFASGSESVCLRMHVTNLFPQLKVSSPSSPTVSTENNLWAMTEEVDYEFIPIEFHVTMRSTWLISFVVAPWFCNRFFWKVRDARALRSMAVTNNFHDPQTGFYAYHFLGNVPLLPGLFLLFTSSESIGYGKASFFESLFYFRTD